MKIRNVQKTLLGTAIAMAIGTVYAQQDPSPQDLLRQHDRDNNQTLSSEEFQELYRAQVGSEQDNIEEQAQQTFDRADTDGNGELAMNELRQAMPLTEAPAGQRGIAGNQNQSDSQQQRGNSPDARAQATDDQRDARGIASTSQSSTGQTRTERQQDGVAQTDPDRQRYQRGDDPGNRSLSQTDQDRSTATERTQDRQSSTLEMTARQNPEELEGREIQDSQQEELGEIERVVRHTRSGDLYVVVTSGGFAGFGQDRSVILITELQEQGDTIIYTGQQEQMQAYEESQYEEFTAETAQVEVDTEQERDLTVASIRQGDSQQASQSQGLEQMVKQNPNELEGKEVRDGRAGNKVGEIEMVVLDKQNNEFHVVLSSDEVLGVGGDDMVVAITELESDGDGYILRSEQSARPFTEQDYLKVEEI